MENVNCETSLTRNEPFLSLMTSVLAILQCRVNSNLGSYFSIAKRVCMTKCVE